MAFIFRVLLLL